MKINTNKGREKEKKSVNFGITMMNKKNTIHEKKYFYCSVDEKIYTI